MHIVYLIAALSAGNVEQLREDYRAAIGAYQQGDAAQMKAAAGRLIDRRPGSPTFLYLAAAADAMSGESEAALRRLEQLADMGLAMRADQEPAFDSLRDNTRFARLIERFSSNADPQGNVQIVARLGDGHFIPESVAYDPRTGRWLIGSVRQRRIVAIDADGQVSDFVTSGEHGLMSAMGMKLDVAARRLFVATTGAPEAPDTPGELLGRSGILVFDADSGDLLASHLLPDTGREQWLGDLLLGEDRVWASDSKSGEIWCLDLGEGRWHRAVEAGHLSSPQGLAPGLAKEEIYVADYTGGLWRLSTTDAQLSPVDLPQDVNAYGIDGLYRHDDSLIAIQNGHRPNRVIRFELGDGGRRITGQRVLAAALPEFDDPTLGTIVDGELHFVANSHWPRFDADKNLPPAEELTGPIIMKVALE